MKRPITDKPAVKAPVFRQVHEVQSHIDLSWKDRIRLLFGARIGLHLEIATQWRQEIGVKSAIAIWNVRKPKWFRKAADTDRLASVDALPDV